MSFTRNSDYSYYTSYSHFTSSRKILVIGDSSTGKFDVMSRLVGQPFGSKSQESSYTKTRIVGDVSVTVRAEHLERFSFHTTSSLRLYRNANVAVIVYDISNRESYDNVGNWIRLVDIQCLEDTKIILIGNKSDLTHNRMVTSAEASEFARTHSRRGISFLEVSAKDGTNIEQLFSLCVPTPDAKAEATPLPLPSSEIEPLPLQSENTGKKIGMTIFSSAIGTGGAIVAGLALLGILNAWNPIGWTILGSCILVAAASCQGVVNKSFGWGAIGLLPGINLLTGIMYGVKKRYDSNTAERNASQPLMAETVAPTPSSIPSRSIILPPTTSSTGQEEKRRIATVLDPSSGVLREESVAQEPPKTCWAGLFSCCNSSPKKQPLPLPPSATPYTLDAKANTANAIFF